MERKSEVIFEKQGDDGTYRLCLPVNANLGEAYKVVAGFLDEIVGSINAYNQRAKNRAGEKPEEKPDDS